MVPGFRALGVDAKGVSPPLDAKAKKLLVLKGQNNDTKLTRHIQRITRGRIHFGTKLRSTWIRSKRDLTTVPPGAPEETRGAATPGVAIEADATNDDKRASSSGGGEREGEVEDMMGAKRAQARTRRQKSS